MQAQNAAEREKSKKDRQYAAPPARSKAGGLAITKKFIDFFLDHVVSSLLVIVGHSRELSRQSVSPNNEALPPRNAPLPHLRFVRNHRHVHPPRELLKLRRIANLVEYWAVQFQHDAGMLVARSQQPIESLFAIAQKHVNGCIV